MQTPPLFSSEDGFDAIIEMLLTANSPLSYSLLPSIEAWLRQFNISSRIEAVDILHEAYLRAKTRKKPSEVIYHPPAWLKRVCYNVVREHSKKLDKQRLTEPEMLEGLEARVCRNQQVSEDLLSDRVQTMFDAFKILERQDPESAELLNLRECEGLSWIEVQACLLARGRDVPDLATLRQRGTRARKQLRRIFHETENVRV